jgi:hypothetical protein
VHHVAINNIELCQDFDYRDSQIRRFWSLEAMGITHTDTAPHAIKDTATLSSFSDSFRIEDGRAVVSLPKKEHVIPADNQTKARRRMKSDEKFRQYSRLQNNVRKQNTGLHTSTSSQSRSALRFCSTKVPPAASCVKKKNIGRKIANRF